MPKFDDYTQKTEPEDTDIALILDKTANVNKKTPFSGVWNWIVSKLTSAVISQLETINKSIVPAINELNSKIPPGYETDADMSSGIIVFRWNANTLHTPYKENIVSAGDGMIISYADEKYGVQLCLCWAYANLLIRSKSSSAWSKWKVVESIAT